MNDLLYLSHSEHQKNHTAQNSFQLVLDKKYDAIISSCISPAGLWHVVRFGSSYYLRSLFQISHIEIIDDGIDEGRIIAHAIIDKSFYCYSYRNPVRNECFRIDEQSFFGIDDFTLTSMPLEMVQLFSNIIRLSPAYTFKYDKAIIDAVIAHIDNLTSMPFVDILREIKYLYSLSDLKRSAKSKNLDEYVTLVQQVLRTIDKPFDVDGYDSLSLHRFDFSDSDSSGVLDASFELAPIKPDQIRARSFSNIDTHNVIAQSQQAMWKTEQAEKQHQAMLEDIASFLISQGITPKESSSIDLAYSENKTFILCEIKSANADNLTSQIEKGIIQVLYYRYVIKEKIMEPIDARLIVFRCVEDYVFLEWEKFCKSLNIALYVYDSSLTWPNRLLQINCPAK